MIETRYTPRRHNEQIEDGRTECDESRLDLQSRLAPVATLGVVSVFMYQPLVPSCIFNIQYSLVRLDRLCGCS
jgi:hypothetical protein